ncbi:hypothetical protein ACHQM5_004663 [Ranunculus cassubicifolius]
MEEFDEFEVLWSETKEKPQSREKGKIHPCPKRKVPENLGSIQSSPISIPMNKVRSFKSNWLDFEVYEEKEEKMVPPHEILAKRFNGKMAFSVCTGNGRTLKGRDLSKVRNSVLLKTGFLESC